MSNAKTSKGLRELIHDAVDTTAVRVGNIHQVIADAPLDALAKFDVLEEPARRLQETQDTVVGAIYDTVRKVNREVQRFGDDLLR